MYAIKHDNKNHDKINMILLKVINSAIYDVPVEWEAIKASIENSILMR